MNSAVAIYRVSSEHQVLSGNGLSAQKDSVRSFAKQNGLSIVSEHSDEGISGSASLDKRKGLLDGLQALQKGMVLLVHKMDRLSRDVFLMCLIEREVKKKGCRIVSVSGEGTGSDNPQDTLMRSLLISFAQYEKDLISLRTKQALQARKRRGLRTGTVPYGFSALEDGTLIENASEQALVALVSAARNPNEGKKESWSKVAQRLNDEGFSNRAGRKWSSQNLWIIFKDRV